MKSLTLYPDIVGTEILTNYLALRHKERCQISTPIAFLIEKSLNSNNYIFLLYYICIMFRITYLQGTFKVWNLNDNLTQNSDLLLHYFAKISVDPKFM